MLGQNQNKGLRYLIPALLWNFPQFSQAEEDILLAKSDENVKVVGDRLYDTTEGSEAYKSDKSTSATRLKLKPEETPQTINTVSHQQMEDFNLRDAREAVQRSPGVIVQKVDTERSTYFSRGSEISSFQFDGIGVPIENYNLQRGEIDSFLFDRIEVLKGANGLTSSLGEPGASINFVRKRPGYDFKSSAAVTHGSFDRNRIEGDVSGPLNKDKSFRARLLGAVQKNGSYLDNYSREKGLASLILEYDLDESTTFALGHFTNLETIKGSNGVGLPLMGSDGRQIHYPRSSNPVPKWALWEQADSNSFGELRRDLTENWSLKATYQYEKVDSDTRLNRYVGNPRPDGSGVSSVIGRYISRYSTKSLDLNLNGSFELFGRRHESVVGAAWSIRETRVVEAPGSGIFPVTGWWSFSPNHVEPDWSGKSSNSANIGNKLTSTYAATRLHLADPVHLLLGVNHVRANGGGHFLVNNMEIKEEKSIPYAGLTYKFLPSYTAYSSYTTIFQPNVGVDANNNSLKPTEGKAIEFGIKGSWLGEKLIGTIAQFRTEQRDYPLRVNDINPLMRNYQVGDLNTSGYELNLTGSLTPTVDMSAGFVSTRMYDKEQKETRTFVPSRVGSALVSYKLTEKARVGMGALYQSKIYLDTNVLLTPPPNPQIATYRVRQGEVTLLDLMGRYDLNEELNLQLNFRNIGNKKYLLSIKDSAGHSGPPSEFLATLSYQD